MRLSLAPDQQFSRSYSMLMEDDIEKKDEEEVNLLEQRRTSLYDNIRSWVGRWDTSQYSIWNVTQNGMSLKMECHSKWNVTQN